MPTGEAASDVPFQHLPMAVLNRERARTGGSEFKSASRVYRPAGGTERPRRQQLQQPDTQSHHFIFLLLLFFHSSFRSKWSCDARDAAADIFANAPSRLQGNAAQTTFQTTFLDVVHPRARFVARVVLQRGLHARHVYVAELYTSL